MLRQLYLIHDLYYTFHLCCGELITASGRIKTKIPKFGIVKKCAVEENPKSEIDRYQAA